MSKNVFGVERDRAEELTEELQPKLKAMVEGLKGNEQAYCLSLMLAYGVFYLARSVGRDRARQFGQISLDNLPPDKDS